MKTNIKSIKLNPLLKYPGGKEAELKYIHQYLPSYIKSYYEPFLGGGAAFLSIESEKYFVNDKSVELMQFYENVASGNQSFFEKLNAINHNWKLITDLTINHSTQLLELYKEYYNEDINELELSNHLFEFVLHNVDEFNGLLTTDFNMAIEDFVNILKRTMLRRYKRMKVLSKTNGEISDKDIIDNIESSFKASFYTHLRNIHNNNERFDISPGFSSAIYLFIRQMCYSSMFRYNKSGGFNVPYGGISYNKNSFDRAIDYYQSEPLLDHFGKTIFGNLDFYEFMTQYPPQKDDFVFLDPPYDSEFSTYSNNQFVESDQERLAKYLINECKANFMLIIKNTDLISSLYPADTPTNNGKSINIFSFDKRYSVSFKNRNEQNVKHLVITNYSEND